MKRRLVAILAADVVAYSRLMSEDESGTLVALQAHRAELFDPKVSQYGGRTIKLMGDGALVEFPSVVDAVTFAVEVQCAMHERNAGGPEDKQIVFRIGINIGDVIIEGDDIYGDGVNLAARLEGLADPGGICLSRDVRNQVRDKLGLDFEDRGEIEVKNIPRPVHTFAVILDQRAAAMVTPVEAMTVGPGRRRSLAAAGLAGLAVAAALAWWQPWTPQREAVPIEQAALALPEKPSIAVLPFDNLSDDPAQSYFADGMTEDLITDLSKISGLFVIARNSSFQYKGKSPDLRAVGRELGVKFVLEGSVRRAGDKVRINAQLVDATTGRHLWAERYDGALADVFALQDRVTAQIVASLSVTLSSSEQVLAEQIETSVPEAYDAFLTGWRHFRLRTVEDYRTALTWLEKAVTLDPDYSRAWALMASLYHEAWEREWTDQLDISAEKIPQLLDKALQRPTPLAYRIKAERLMSQGRLDDAEIWLDKASTLDPNDPDTFVRRSRLVAIRGDTDTAIALMRTAMRLDPHYPASYLYSLGAIYLRAGDAAKAIEFLERAWKRNPGDWSQLVFLTVAYAEDGRLEDAERAAKTLVERRRELGFLVTLAASFDTWWGVEGTYRERIHQALLKVGLPDMPRPEDLNLSPKFLLSGAELREALKSGYRHKGRASDGVWMRDMYPDGSGVHYWKGRQTSTTTSKIEGDMEFTERSNGRKTRCTFYRNPEGTKENLNEFISVCAHGIYPYAVFPLPETTQ